MTSADEGLTVTVPSAAQAIVLFLGDGRTVQIKDNEPIVFEEMTALQKTVYAARLRYITQIMENTANSIQLSSVRYPRVGDDGRP